MAGGVTYLFWGLFFHYKGSSTMIKGSDQNFLYEKGQAPREGGLLGRRGHFFVLGVIFSLQRVKHQDKGVRSKFYMKRVKHQEKGVYLAVGVTFLFWGLFLDHHRPRLNATQSMSQQQVRLCICVASRYMKYKKPFCVS